MDIKTILTVFISVFLAEIGDKTQLATMLFSADKKHSALSVFIGSATALVLASGIGVIAGSYLSELISPQSLKIAAGIGFILIGIWTLVGK
ncbi:MAG: TMEM165/GDT1 family protein [Leptospiraceae bacterium]|nr:TMEM165/GDT1 family protein [Leptospiraceae bacterium]